MKTIDDLRVKIFADGADKAGMLEMYAKPYIKGFTTNPTLMRKAGVTDYRAFAKDILRAIPDRPISFEVLSDEFDVMDRQAREISTWGSQVFVKIPITNTRREPTYDLVKRLSKTGVKVNVTALLTLEQVSKVVGCVTGGSPCYVSIFAGRVADTGRDPVPIMAKGCGDFKIGPQCRTHLGKPSRVVEHLPGRRNWLPHYHCDERHSEEAFTCG